LTFNCTKMCLAGRLCLDPLGEITALLRTPWLDFRGSDRERREREGKKETEEGRERGKEGGGMRPPPIKKLVTVLKYPYLHTYLFIQHGTNRKSEAETFSKYQNPRVSPSWRRQDPRCGRWCRPRRWRSCPAVSGSSGHS